MQTHCEELLNRQIPPNLPDIDPAHTDLNISCGQPTREEIRKAIKLLRNGKAAGPHNKPAQTLRADLENSIEVLHPLFTRI